MWFKFAAFCSNWLRQKKEVKAKQKQLQQYHAILENISAFKTTEYNALASLVFKLDDIGDYLLFEDAFYNWALQTQKTQQLYLVGNETWKALFELKFKDIAIVCIWVNKTKWLAHEQYRIQLAKTLHTIAPSKCLYPSLTRSLLLEASMGSLFPKAEHIGCNNNKNADQQLAVPLLTKAINTPKFAHELALNAHFFGGQIFDVLPNENEKAAYFIVGIGGNQKSKHWSPKKYSQLIKALLNKYPNLCCHVLGGKAEHEQAQLILKAVNNTRCINSCEKIKLDQLAGFCIQAEFAICNDTAVAHVCALNKVPLIVVANGNRYGRFFPYPANFSWVKTVYPVQLKMNLPVHYDWEAKFPINAIQTQMVLNQLTFLLDATNN